MGKAVGRPVVNLLGGQGAESGGFLGLPLLQIQTPHRWASARPIRHGLGSARQKAALNPAGSWRKPRPCATPSASNPSNSKAAPSRPTRKPTPFWPCTNTSGSRHAPAPDRKSIWSVATSVRIGERLKGVLEYYESPTRGQAAMGEVGRRTGIPLANQACPHIFRPHPRQRAAPLGRHHPQQSPFLGGPCAAQWSFPVSARSLAGDSPCTPTATSACLWRP